MGAYLKYYVVQGVLIIFPIIFFIIFWFCPETPVYLMKHNKLQDAQDALKFLRGISKDSVTISEEVQVELDSLQKIGSNQVLNSTQDNKITFFDFKSRAVKKGIMIGIVFAGMNQFSGCFALINFTAQIFEEAKTGLDPNLSAIVVGVIQIAGSYGSLYFVDRAGRRKLYLVSAMGTALGLIVMGGYSFLKLKNFDVSSFGIVPVISLSFVIFIASCGILPLAFIIISEILPQKLRSFATSLCMVILWTFAFIVIQVLRDIQYAHFAYLTYIIYFSILQHW